MKLYLRRSNSSSAKVRRTCLIPMNRSFGRLGRIYDQRYRSWVPQLPPRSTSAAGMYPAAEYIWLHVQLYKSRSQMVIIPCEVMFFGLFSLKSRYDYWKISVRPLLLGTIWSFLLLLEYYYKSNVIYISNPKPPLTLSPSSGVGIVYVVGTADGTSVCCERIWLTRRDPPARPSLLPCTVHVSVSNRHFLKALTISFYTLVCILYYTTYWESQERNKLGWLIVNLWNNNVIWV